MWQYLGIKEAPPAMARKMLRSFSPSLIRFFLSVFFCPVVVKRLQKRERETLLLTSSSPRPSPPPLPLKRLADRKESFSFPPFPLTSSFPSFSCSSFCVAQQTFFLSLSTPLFPLKSCRRRRHHYLMDRAPESGESGKLL